MKFGSDINDMMKSCWVSIDRSGKWRKRKKEKKNETIFIIINSDTNRECQNCFLTDVYAICSYFALLMFLANAIDKMDPTSGNSEKLSAEMAIRPIFRSRYWVTLI